MGLSPAEYRFRKETFDGNKKVSEKKDSWLKVLLSYTEGSGQRLGISVILSVISIISGLMPYYCIYRGIDLYIRNLNQDPMQEILRWCLYALLFYIIKIVSFSASTWISHIAAYHIYSEHGSMLSGIFLLLMLVYGLYKAAGKGIILLVSFHLLLMYVFPQCPTWMNMVFPVLVNYSLRMLPCFWQVCCCFEHRPCRK